MMIKKTITFLIFSLIFLGVHAQSKKTLGIFFMS